MSLSIAAFIATLFLGGAPTADQGCMIDPNGCAPRAVTYCSGATDPNGCARSSSDGGITINPNG